MMSIRVCCRCFVGPVLGIGLLTAGMQVMVVGSAAPARADQACAVHAGRGADPSGWADARLAPAPAWAVTRGGGQRVAVVDSGVDGTVAQLSGRISDGADLAGDGSDGRQDCVGTGTAMAALVAASSASGESVAGIAPAVTIVPIRVSTSGGVVPDSEGADGIRLASSAGGSVIVLGAEIDPDGQQTRAAVAKAVRAGCVVVESARSGSSEVRPARGQLRVAGVGIDGSLTGDYPHGSVDVVAPGIDVESLGVTGVGAESVTGAQYAAALTGGEVALVRAANPHASPAEVTDHVESSTTPVEAIAPDRATAATFGHGMIDPVLALEHPIDASAQARSQAGHAARARPSSGRHPNLVLALAVAAGVVLVLLTGLVVRRRLSGPSAITGARRTN